MYADKTYEIADWPSQANCEQPYADTIEQLDPDKTKDLEGNWSLSPKKSYGLWLLFPQGCSDPLPWISRGEDGHLLMTFSLQSLRDPDTAQPDQMIVFRKD